MTTDDKQKQIQSMLEAIREFQNTEYIMTQQEYDALFGSDASKPKPKVEPKSLPRKELE